MALYVEEIEEECVGGCRGDPDADGEQLMGYCTWLLLAAGVPVTPQALKAVARTAPRSEEDAVKPCACGGRCAATLIEAEKKAGYRRFAHIAMFFLEELPEWDMDRRWAAESVMSRWLED